MSGWLMSGASQPQGSLTGVWGLTQNGEKALVMCYVAFVLKSKTKSPLEGNNHSEGKKQGARAWSRAGDRLAEGPHLDTVSLGATGLLY